MFDEVVLVKFIMQRAVKFTYLPFSGSNKTRTGASKLYEIYK